jgi:hypothetical protein
LLKQKALKRTRSMADISIMSKRSWFASLRDHLAPSSMVELSQSEKPYHYQKRSLNHAVSIHTNDVGEPSPYKQTLKVASRAIEPAPASPDSIDTPNRSSGFSRPCAFDDFDSVSSGSIYSPISSPPPLVHCVLPPIEDEDTIEQTLQKAPEESVFEQRLAKHATLCDNDKRPTPPPSALYPRTVSFSRPTPQVYPYLINETTAQQERSQRAPPRPPTSLVRTNVASQPTPPPLSAPLPTPPLPNRNPRRSPSDSGRMPLIHATLDRPFLGRPQDKSSVLTPSPTTIVLKQPVPPLSRRQKRLTSVGTPF